MRKFLVRDDFIVLEPKKHNGRIVMLEGSDPNKISISDMIVIGKGPKARDVEIGDSVVVDRGALLTFKEDGNLYCITKQENVGVVLKNK